MSLKDSLADIQTRLENWSTFPKYSLERRIDIFLTPFLTSLVRKKLGGAEVELVAPEFPILAELARYGPGADRDALSARTVNADYLLHRKGHPVPWVLLELKTDAFSFEDAQAITYAVARARGMERLTGDLAYVQGRTRTRHRDKYEHLRHELRKRTVAESPIAVAYLAPKSEKERALSLVHEGAKVVDEFISLEDFAALTDDDVPAEHREFWPFVQGLLSMLGRKPAGGTDPSAR